MYITFNFQNNKEHILKSKDYSRRKLSHLVHIIFYWVQILYGCFTLHRIDDSHARIRGNFAQKFIPFVKSNCQKASYIYSSHSWSQPHFPIKIWARGAVTSPQVPHSSTWLGHIEGANPIARRPALEKSLFLPQPIKANHGSSGQFYKKIIY